VVLEATGGYEATLVKYLQDNQIAVHRANTRIVKSFIRSLAKDLCKNNFYKLLDFWFDFITPSTTILPCYVKIIFARFLNWASRRKSQKFPILNFWEIFSKKYQSIQ
jgi:hypothetical protein